MSDDTLTPAQLRGTDEYAELKAAGHTDSAIFQMLSDKAADAAEGDEAPKDDSGSGPSDETAATHDGGTPEAEKDEPDPGGDRPPKAIDDMNFDELMKVAQDLDIAGRSTMDKETLFDAIVSHQDG